MVKKYKNEIDDLFYDLFNDEWLTDKELSRKHFEAQWKRKKAMKVKFMDGFTSGAIIMGIIVVTLIILL